MIYVVDPKERIKTIALDAIVQGFRSLGYTHMWVSSLRTTALNKDCVVCFGLPNIKLRKQIKRSQSRLLIVDYGVLKRPEHWTVGFDNLMGRGNFYNDNMPDGRWLSMGIAIKPWKEICKGTHIVIAGQVPTDSSVSRVHIFEWYKKLIDKIRLITNRTIIFRPHPLARDITPDFNSTVKSTGTLQEDLENAHAVLTWNSTSSSAAIIEGVPIFVFDKGSIAWDIANHKLENLPHPKMPDRQQWLNNLAYTQWSLTELESGRAITHIQRGLPDNA